MHLSPDDIVYFRLGSIRISATLVYTWLIIFILGLLSFVVRQKISSGQAPRKLQSLFEVIVLSIKEQIEEMGLVPGERYLSFTATLFLFIGTAHLLILFPFYITPTSSLSTTSALAIIVFFSVPFFGISKVGLKNYFLAYFKPSFLLFPFHLLSEFSRTLALAVRLFGNMMSGEMILAILLIIAPLFFPILMTALGLLTGMVQAYIFTILATVYIAAATRGHES